MRPNMKKLMMCLMVVAFVLTVMPMAAAAEDGGEKININTASLEELATLKRVGLKYAQRILDYREQNGKFKSPEEIMAVSGIGPKTYEINKNRIVTQ